MTNEKKKSKLRIFLGICFDFIMLCLTGGFWLVWVIIRYLRKRS